MPEYIDRDIAVKAVMAAKWESGSDGSVAMEIVASAPAADVEPVRHGRWIWRDDGYSVCSVCGQKAPIVPQYQDEPITVQTNYCPNCGAKMDEEVKA